MQPTTERALVSIYRSPRKQDMYLYVAKTAGFKEVPEALLKQFGSPTHVMDLLITRNKKLARVEAGRLLDELMERGFYLQMPPAKDDYLLNLYKEPLPGRDSGT